MANTYVGFLSDEDIFDCFEMVFNEYQAKYSGFDLKKFSKNLVDPFEMIFTAKITGLSADQWIMQEANRQINKSITNVIGSFQEEVLGHAPNFKRYKVGQPGSHSMDIINDSRTIFADVKNKFNTLKGANKPDLFRNFQDVLRDYPNATTYYVQIIAKGSFNRQWAFTAKDKKYFNPRIREISGDQFYKIVFGIDDAFYQLINALPKALEDYMKNHNTVLNLSLIHISEPTRP